MVSLAALIARFFEVWFYLAFGLAKQLVGFGCLFNLRLGFLLLVTLGLGMRTLAWNCRGAGRAPTVRALKALIREESPDVVFIAKSKSKARRIERIRSSIGFVDKFCVEPVGKSGGLAIFWKARRLEELVSAFAGPWLVMGDFNCVDSNLDKRGGRYLGEASTRSFRNFVHATGAIDLGFIGSRFMWSNKREGLANIKERLDKAVCNQE